MADKRRFALFAELIVRRFPDAGAVYDVAGGMGKLNEALLARGRRCVTFDTRWKHAAVEYREELFTLELPCEAGVVAGLHADGATRLCVEYAARHGIGFAIVPCCSDNGMPYKPWMRHLEARARELGASWIEEEVLPMEGRARVLLGGFDQPAAASSPSR